MTSWTNTLSGDYIFTNQVVFTGGIKIKNEIVAGSWTPFIYAEHLLVATLYDSFGLSYTTGSGIMNIFGDILLNGQLNANTIDRIHISLPPGFSNSVDGCGFLNQSTLPPSGVYIFQVTDFTTFSERTNFILEFSENEGSTHIFTNQKYAFNFVITTSSLP